MLLIFRLLRQSALGQTFMLQRIKTHIKNRIGFYSKSYSQEGEDMVLKRIFGSNSIGWYIDVGAHHPMRFSNTYYFYKQGWQGINIDAMPNIMGEFKKYRPKDINIHAAISENNETLNYYKFTDHAFNTLDDKVGRERENRKKDQFLGKETMITKRLDEILEEHLPEGKSIDFLSIDVEGLDLSVLNSNNFDKYRPKIILAEVSRKTINEIIDDQVYTFLTSKGYKLFSKTVNTLFFIEESYMQKRFG